MKKEFPNKQELINWLKKTTSAVLLTISMVGGVQEVHYQASSIRALAEISQFSPDYFHNGSYVVEYQDIGNDENDDLVYTNIATAFTFKARLAQHTDTIIGGMDALRDALSGYEYIAEIKREQFGYIGYLLVLMPEAPDELENLKGILHNLSVSYIIPDGSGTINQTNLKNGLGLWGNAG